MSNDFLELLKSSKRGRLKVILGMSAGVGKTVAMLREGKRLRGEGVDVVAGIVETHGRADTLAEVDGVDIIPRRTVVYKGVPFEEMDLDAVAQRKPDLALIDELAHSNVPGSVFDKRYQDVDDLLGRGISVMGTLNVQHVESLHDIVLRETGVDVRERVPDRFLRDADEIIVVDLAPADLQERLRQGKIYHPQKIDRALAGFFRHDKLAALRQLALREVANGVEDRERARDDHRHTEAPESPRQSVVDAERVMVCMSSKPSATRRLLRHGARLTGRLNSRWYVVYVRTPGETPERIDSAALRSLSDNIRLAKELGADVVRLEGTDIVQELTRFARERCITHAIFGRTRRPIWLERIQGSFIDRFTRAVPEVDIVVVGDRPDSPEEAT